MKNQTTAIIMKMLKSMYDNVTWILKKCQYFFKKFKLKLKVYNKL